MPPVHSCPAIPGPAPEQRACQSSVVFLLLSIKTSWLTLDKCLDLSKTHVFCKPSLPVCDLLASHSLDSNGVTTCKPKHRTHSVREGIPRLHMAELEKSLLEEGPRAL